MVLLLWFLIVTCSCCPYLYFGSPIMWVTYSGSWMTTCLGKSCSFGLPRVPFVNCCQFTYLVISLLVLRAGYGIWLYQFLISAYGFTFKKMHVRRVDVISMIFGPDTVYFIMGMERGVGGMERKVRFMKWPNGYGVGLRIRRSCIQAPHRWSFFLCQICF